LSQELYQETRLAYFAEVLPGSSSSDRYMHHQTIDGEHARWASLATTHIAWTNLHALQFSQLRQHLLHAV